MDSKFKAGDKVRIRGPHSLAGQYRQMTIVATTKHCRDHDLPIWTVKRGDNTEVYCETVLELEKP